MTDHLTPSERALRQAAAYATPGEWEWWNGCSWWRLGVKYHPDQQTVIEPTRDSDGHPNLIVRAEDRRYIVAAQPRAVLALLDEIGRLRGALVEIAAFGDAGASERLARDGSYASFDEPSSVAKARSALAEKDKPEPERPKGCTCIVERKATWWRTVDAGCPHHGRGDFELVEDDTPKEKNDG